MEGIAVSTAMFLLKGIPEGFLVAWGMHILTNTPVRRKPYLMLSLLYIVITYLIRFLPIKLALIGLFFRDIFSYQIVYHANCPDDPAMIAAISSCDDRRIGNFECAASYAGIRSEQQTSGDLPNQSAGDLYQAFNVFLGMITLAGTSCKAINKGSRQWKIVRRWRVTLPDRRD